MPKKSTDEFPLLGGDGASLNGKTVTWEELGQILLTLDQLSTRHDLLGYEGEFGSARVQLESFLEDDILAL